MTHKTGQFYDARWSKFEVFQNFHGGMSSRVNRLFIVSWLIVYWSIVNLSAVSWSIISWLPVVGAYSVG